ncbi:unnamed protein product [Staurois parvus]|uniref:THAP-type domain-containing protein n=1 Tax=Staurois parvus TaxID=386267 RepID=A0ABN9ADV5_9NEOB|nr:unnamed protein product [Staurois parvus]
MIFSTFSFAKMPRHCSALGCTTRDSRLTRENNISFHRLPRKEDPRRNLWIANCRRTDPSGNGLWDPSSEYVYFCSRHFEKNCFEVTGISCYHRLKEVGPLPALYLHLTTLTPEGYTPKSRHTKVRKQQRQKVKRKLDFLRSDHAAACETADPSGNQCFDARRYDGVPTPDLVNFHGLCPENIDIPGDAAPAEGALATTVDHQMHPEATLEDIEVGTVIGGPLSDLELSHVQEDMSSEICVNTDPEGSAEGVGEQPRPVSPSVYMMRIPQPPGAYIQNEHSYHVGNALLLEEESRSRIRGIDQSPETAGSLQTAGAEASPSHLCVTAGALAGKARTIRRPREAEGASASV